MNSLVHESLVYFLHVDWASAMVLLLTCQVAAAVGGEIFEFEGTHKVPMDEAGTANQGDL